jgi:hypothetical protein
VSESVGISTRTPYCSTVCLCLNNSLMLGGGTFCEERHRIGNHRRVEKVEIM